MTDTRTQDQIDRDDDILIARALQRQLDRQQAKRDADAEATARRIDIYHRF